MPFPSESFVREVLTLAALRLLVLGDDDPPYPIGKAILRERDLQPEHRQVQVVISCGENENAVLETMPIVLPAILEELTMRDFRTGQAMLVLSANEINAKDLAAKLQQQIVVHFFGTSGVPDRLSTQFVLNLMHPMVLEHARQFHGKVLTQEIEYYPEMSQDTQNLEDEVARIVDRLALCLQYNAAGDRLATFLR